jgi:hypothetical protein
MTGLILKRAKVSRPSGQWGDDDYDVICQGAVKKEGPSEVVDDGPLGTLA